MKDPLSARPQASDDRRTFESVLDSARKKVGERNFNGAVDDCKLAMTILMARPPSMAIQHSISECLECMADAYFAQQQHEHALTKYEEAFQVRGQVFQRVEKPMMELLFKLERTLGHLVASGYVEKFNETENRWKAFVLNPGPGMPEARPESIIPGQDVEELQQLWKRVARKQKSEVRVSNLINRLSMPSLLIPAAIIFVLLITVPLVLSYVKSANEAVANKQNQVDGSGKGDTDGGANSASGENAGDKNTVSSGGQSGSESGSGSASSSGTGAGSSPGNQNGAGSSGPGAEHGGSRTGGGTKIASASVPANSSTGSGAASAIKSDLLQWLDGVKNGNYSDKELSTADKDVVLKFQSDKTVRLKNGTLPPMECAYYADGGSISDLFALLEKIAFHKCYWLSLSKLGFMDAAGTNFFDTSTPEFNTIQQMAHLAIQGKDFAGMRRIGGDNVSFKTPAGKSADAIVSAMKPELAGKKPLSIVCVMMPDTKKKTVFMIGLDRNRNLLGAGRSGRNIVTAGDVDFSRQVLPEFENVILTDTPVQQARYKAVYLLSVLAVALLLLCIFVRVRAVKMVGVVLMIIVVILTVIALANTLQSLGLQKLK